MTAQPEQMQNGVGGRRPQLRQRALETLRLLISCPLVPVDALVHLVGFSSASAAYKQLDRLKRSGLAEMQRADLGYLLGERRLTLWKITEKGRRTLRAVGVGQHSEGASASRMLPYGAGRLGTRRACPREIDLPLLVAAYRLLASIVAEGAAEGRAVDVCAWEWPWVRGVWSEQRRKVLRVRLPAGVVLLSRRLASDDAEASGHARPALLLPDLGTAPVARYREMLRRLVALRRARIEGGCADPEPEVIIATPDPDQNGARSAAWLELLDRVARRQQEPALHARVLGWERVADVVGRARLPGLVGDSVLPGVAGDGRRQALRSWRAPVQRREQLLHLIGRHPFLTVEQLALLLGTTFARISQLEQEMVESGLLRSIDVDELPGGAIGLDRNEWQALGLVGITQAGLHRLASWLGLDARAAARYHGLIGNGRGQAGRRRRLLRTLAHTIGTNDVFVTFASAPATARRQGGTDRLAEWRGAAACERRRCKPDGYGSYVRNGVAYGFFLEYDRGTEPARKYAAKFRAYYRYRDSGQAMRDYDSFPTLLFVTIDPAAEVRIAEQAYRAWFIRDTEPLPILITTTDRIVGNREGILGRIWCTPALTAPPNEAKRQYWLPGRPQPGLVGAGRDMAPAPRIVWHGRRGMFQGSRSDVRRRG